MTPSAQWSADPTQRTVGTIVLNGPNGGDVDLIASNSIRSGEIAAYLEMRDQVLVAGADAARRDRAGDGARPVRPDDRRHAGRPPARSPASTSI